MKNDPINHFLIRCGVGFMVVGALILLAYYVR